jgi:formate hydrogenlyase transcriptional activator
MIRQAAGRMPIFLVSSHDSSASGLTLDRVLATAAVRFVQSTSDEVDEAIVDTQRLIVDALDLDRSELWLVDAEGQAACTHRWPPFVAVDAAPGADRTGAPGWLGEVLSGATTARDTGGGVAVVPVPGTDGMIGALALFATTGDHRWSPELLERLQLAGLLFGQTLSRGRADASLRQTLSEVQRLRDRLAATEPAKPPEPYAPRAPRTIVAESPAIKRVLAELEPVAPTTATVLLLGETGSGKEVIARAVHEMSPRAQRPLVRVNCAAIPAALIESELFGRERGAYTGALSKQIGRFELADRSTLFLDEVGELSLEAQVKLLRVLQDGVIERLGSTQPIKVDVRIIAATNRNLDQAVRDRTFREDLYYRLNVYPVTVPPLRDRRQDIPALAWTFAAEFSRAFGKRIDSISRESLAALQEYHWPGNVRELRNTIERAVIIATGPHLAVEPPQSPAASATSLGTLADREASHIRAVLDAAGWRVRGAGGAAERLGMKPTTLESRMAKLGIRRPTP